MEQWDYTADYTPFVNRQIIDCLVTYPPDPLPLAREGGSVGKRGGSAPSLFHLPPLLQKERGIKGVRLINNLKLCRLSIGLTLLK
jgi:hypothetical protein